MRDDSFFRVYMNKFYITTPVYYVNDVPHIGHTYTTVAADILARYHRMVGDKTFFLTGTDEHGANIENKAKQIGKKPQQFADEISAQFQLAWHELNISHNNFLRTTNPGHLKAVQKALEYMHKKGDIYLGKYQGLYCRGCEQFKSETDLVDGLCPDHLIKPEKVSEDCYTFRLSKYQSELLKKIRSDELKILPDERKNEIISFYEKPGLADVSFSRKNVKWGIPLPWDKSQTVYVWADAFLNYLTGLGWSPYATSYAKASEVKKVSGDKDGNWNSLPSEAPLGGAKEWWPPDLQLMSKDILRVHATIWPAMLLSLELPLPKQLFIHGYFLINGQKMSKSLGNVITPGQLIKKYGVDGTRYLLMSTTSFGSDSDISWRWFDEKYNADLANGLGNLVARATTLALSLAKTKIKLHKTAPTIEVWAGQEFNHSVGKVWQNYKQALWQLKIDQALSIASQQQKFLDSYITTTRPWQLIKDNKPIAGTVIYNVLERLRQISWLIWPFMPQTTEKIWQALGLDFKSEIKKDLKTASRWLGLKPSCKVKKIPSLFPRI